MTQNLAHAMFEVDGYFPREPEHHLRKERTEIRHAASILEVIGRGCRPACPKVRWHRTSRGSLLSVISSG